MTKETRRELQDIADDYGFIEKAGWPGVVVTMKQYLMPCLEAAYELGEKAGRSAQAVIDAKIAFEAKTNYEAEDQILAGFRQHQEGQ